MKKGKIVLVMSVILLALSMAFISCDSDDSERYEPLVIRGRIDGRPSEIIFRTNRTISRSTVMTPETGDSFEILFTDVNPPDVILRGTIRVIGMYLTFFPSGGGQEFYGSLSGNYVNIHSIPLSDGIQVSFTRPGVSTGTGGGSRQYDRRPEGHGETYIITGSDNEFTATLEGVIIGEANQPIQDIIDAIRIHANNAQYPNIQLAEDGKILDIGTASISFNNDPGVSDSITWGTIILRGSITSANTESLKGTILVLNEIELLSYADIANTGNLGNAVMVIQNYASGWVALTESTITATNGVAVHNFGAGHISIDDTIVTATTGVAVQNDGSNSAAIAINGQVSSGSGIPVKNIGDGGRINIGPVGIISAVDVVAVLNTDGSGWVQIEGTVTTTGPVAVENERYVAMYSGTVSAAAGGVAIANTKLDSYIAFGSNPTLEGRITFVNANNYISITTAGTPDFNFKPEPSNKKYLLDFATPPEGEIAVTNGKGFSNFFVLVDSDGDELDNFELVEDGDDLKIVAVGP
ncbi:MAG: hypothetical protein FWG77_06740 [Treponema sp.]|nr:hypothetical protein [Treponema sp.]